MNSRIGLLASAAVAFGLAAGHAAASPTYGSASKSTYRDCNSVTAADACDGTGPGQQILATVTTGGALSTANSDLTLSGQTLPKPFGAPGTVTVPNDGSFARSTVDFSGGLDLPVIKGSTSSDPSGQDRMNINSIGYQSYDYAGPTTAFSLTSTLDIDDSSSDGGTGVLPGGAIYTAYVAIWDLSVLGSFTSAQDIFDNTFLADCTVSGVLAVGSISGPLTGGPASFSVSTAKCGGGVFMLHDGDEVLAVAGLQLPVNRGGFADAGDTYTTALNPDLGPTAIATLEAGLKSGKSILGVPEPSDWALLVAGFFGLGAALRRRRTGTSFA